MVSIIMMIPTLVASFYGMNVKLPFQNTPFAFLIILGISLATAFLGALMFIGTNAIRTSRRYHNRHSVKKL
jgi:magnesium transporter